MKRILMAVAMMGMTGGAYAADFADLQTIKAQEIKADAAKTAVQPKAEHCEVQFVPSVIVESIEKLVDTSADGGDGWLKYVQTWEKPVLFILPEASNRILLMKLGKTPVYGS